MCKEQPAQGSDAVRRKKISLLTAKAASEKSICRGILCRIREFAHAHAASVDRR